jgi:hypothetical protein
MLNGAACWPENTSCFFWPERRNEDARRNLVRRGRQPSARTSICTARSVRPASIAISRKVRPVRS